MSRIWSSLIVEAHLHSRIWPHIKHSRCHWNSPRASHWNLLLECPFPFRLGHHLQALQAYRKWYALSKRPNRIQHTLHPANDGIIANISDLNQGSFNGVYMMTFSHSMHLSRYRIQVSCEDSYWGNTEKYHISLIQWGMCTHTNWLFEHCHADHFPNLSWQLRDNLKSCSRQKHTVTGSSQYKQYKGNKAWHHQARSPQ